MGTQRLFIFSFVSLLAIMMQLQPVFSEMDTDVNAKLLTEHMHTSVLKEMLLYQTLEKHIQESQLTVSEFSEQIHKIKQQIEELNQRVTEVENNSMKKHAELIAIIAEKEQESKLRFDELKKLAQSLK